MRVLYGNITSFAWFAVLVQKFIKETILKARFAEYGISKIVLTFNARVLFIFLSNVELYLAYYSFIARNTIPYDIHRGLSGTSTSGKISYPSSKSPGITPKILIKSRLHDRWIPVHTMQKNYRSHSTHFSTHLLGYITKG